MKKLLSIIMVISSVLSLCSVSVWAKEDTNSATFVSVNGIVAETYEDLLEEIDLYVRTLPQVTDGQSEISRQELDEMMEKQLGSGIQNRSSSVTLDKIELASVLSLYDGISNSNITTIMYHGTIAKDEAEANNQQENNIYKWDAYRHSTWNFRATKALNASVVKVFTINYEWANQLLDEWQNYYNERYVYYVNYYIDSIGIGAMTDGDLMYYAQCDADDYICEYRDGLAYSCRNIYEAFDATFDNDNIMDFYNNKIGRDYGVNYSSYTPSEMFTTAYNKGELILNLNDASSKKSSAWRTFSLWCPNY